MASQPMLCPRTQNFEAHSSDTLSRLFSSYGASSVRPCTSGRYESFSMYHHGFP
ncbi:hypothetical protein AAG906_012455 [Vitis piasezkii]